jgi:glycosyltransferase involved in cell wall biosynthesis
MKIRLDFARDQTEVHRRRLHYSFSLFCAIYGHQPVNVSADHELADVWLTYTDDHANAIHRRMLHLGNLYQPRPVHEPAPAPTSFEAFGEKTILFYRPLPGMEPDWLGEIFEWVSCADEYSIRNAASVGVVSFSQTFAGRHGLDIRTPYAAIAMRLLQRGLCKLMPGSSEEPLSPTPSVRHFIVNTHDVDFLPLNSFGSVSRLLRNSGAALAVHRRPKLARKLAATAWKTAMGMRNPLDQIPKLVKEEKHRGINASYMFIGGRGHRRDGNYRVDDPAVSELMHSLEQAGMEIGLHGSYCSLDDPHGLPKEFDFLRRQGFRPKGNRQHWLRFTLERLVPALNAAGALYDTSLGWVYKPGFRAGACFAFPPYNFADERPANFLEIPLVVVDVSLEFGDAPVSQSDYYEHVSGVLSTSRRYGWGGVAVLWHNTGFGGGQVPKEVGDVFWRVVDERKSRNDTWLSGADFVRSVRQRYSEVGLLPSDRDLEACYSGEPSSRRSDGRDWIRTARTVQLPTVSLLQCSVQGQNSAGQRQSSRQAARQESAHKRFDVVMLTTVHMAKDVRIFHHEAKTLAEAGFSVGVIGQHPQSEDADGIWIEALKVPTNRFRRLVQGWTVLKRALELSAGVFIFHDPELFWVGLALRASGGKVVYDSHENLPMQVFQKLWLPRAVRWMLVPVLWALEWLSSRLLSGVIVVNETAGRRFPKKRTIVLRNFPARTALNSFSQEALLHVRPQIVIYAGSLSRIRGISELVEAFRGLELKDAQLWLVGKFHESAFEKEILRSLPPNVRWLGWKDYGDVFRLYELARVGALLHHPAPNHRHAMPLKIFEYLGAGLPVIASDLPQLTSVLNGCGVQVNPLDITQIRIAIRELLTDDALVAKMAKVGRERVLDLFCWENEGKRLVEFCSEIVSQ